MAVVFTNDNPSQLYMDVLLHTIDKGDKVSPRGKLVKEVRPAVIEFTDPRNKVTFVKGRRINPFFQLAEFLWIMAGRADVKWLSQYNSNMKQFSDDGVFFNAPYGERLRSYNQNAYRDFIFNPIDQLVDVYEKISKDKDTRQAVAQIYNPAFDNSEYGGKDTPCNLTLTFKVRNNKLDLTVFNRSNDVHWGTFGANLCQFSNIQESVATWLGYDLGTYTVVSDSLHIYLEDYGAKETDKILKAYNMKESDAKYSSPSVEHFYFEDEPRMSFNLEQTNYFFNQYFGGLDQLVHNEKMLSNVQWSSKVLEAIDELTDEYWKNVLFSMVAYQAHKGDMFNLMVSAMSSMKDSQWKLSCLYFLSKKHGDKKEFKNIYSHFSEEKKKYIEGE